MIVAAVVTVVWRLAAVAMVVRLCAVAEFADETGLVVVVVVEVYALAVAFIVAVVCILVLVNGVVAKMKNLCSSHT